MRREGRSPLVLAAVLAACFTNAARSQDRADPLLDVDWQRDEVGVGVHLLRHEFDDLFGAPQSVAVLELAPGVRVDVEAADQRTLTSVMAARVGALAAVNGGFFNVETGAPRGLLRIDDRLVSPATGVQGSVGVDARGRVHVAAVQAGDWPPMVDALGAGPILLRDGRIVDHGERRRAIRHPRTALGLRKDRSVVLVTVDGRTPRAAGMSFEELAAVLVSLGCDVAVNLDGGGSSTMWVQGPGIVNHPCDNKKFDGDGERAVANAVVVTAPAVLVADEDVLGLDDAEFEQRAAGDDAWGGDVAVAVGARVTWSLRAPRPGRYEVFARWPKVEGARPGEVSVQLPDHETTLDQRVRRGRWNRVAEVELGAAPLEMLWVGAADRALLVDAVRLVELR